VASLPTVTESLAAATGSDGRIYAIGGYSYGQALATVEAYDVHSNTWSVVAPLPTAREFLAAATGPDGRIYAIGGSTHDQTFARVEAFTPGPSATPRPPQPTPKPTLPPNERGPSLTLTGVTALDAYDRPQHWFGRGQSGYIRVSWALRRLKGAATLTIQRQFYMPSGRGWKPLPPVAPQQVQAVNGRGYQDSPFFAPKSFRAYQIVARILFRGKWSSPKSTTIQVR
jgi:hypothetical protein